MLCDAIVVGGGVVVFMHFRHMSRVVSCECVDFVEIAKIAWIYYASQRRCKGILNLIWTKEKMCIFSVRRRYRQVFIQMHVHISVFALRWWDFDQMPDDWWEQDFPFGMHRIFSVWRVSWMFHKCYKNAMMDFVWNHDQCSREILTHRINTSLYWLQMHQMD